MSRQYAIELSKIELLGPKEKKVLQNWIKDQVSQKKIAFIGETTPLNSKNTQLKIIIETAKKSDDSVLNFSIVGYFLDAIENEQNDLLTNANSIHFKQYCKSNKCKFLCLMNCILFFFGVSSTCFIALASLTKQDKKILDIIPNNNSTDPVTSPLPDYSNNAAKEWILGFVGAMALLVDVILCCYLSYICCVDSSYYDLESGPNLEQMEQVNKIIRNLNGCFDSKLETLPLSMKSMALYSSKLTEIKNTIFNLRCNTYSGDEFKEMKNKIINFCESSGEQLLREHQCKV